MILVFIFPSRGAALFRVGSVGVVPFFFWEVRGGVVVRLEPSGVILRGIAVLEPGTRTKQTGIKKLGEFNTRTARGELSEVSGRYFALV